MRAISGVVMVALAACGDEPYDGFLEPPPAADGMQLSLKIRVEPGQEITACKNFPIPSGTFDIGRFEHRMQGGSHHLLVFPILLASTLVTDEIHLDCDENEEAQGDRIGFMYGSQSDTGEVAFPKHVAFGATTGIAVQVEFHILNNGDEPIDAEAAVNLWRTREEISGDAGTIFAFHNLIAIPPMSTGTAQQRCPIAQDINLMNLVPHMHSRGTAMQVIVDRGGGATETVVDVAGWDEDTVTFDPPLHLNAGDVLDVRCFYDNQTPAYVFDGGSASRNEMCVTGGLYWRDGPRLDIQDEICRGEGIQWTGTQSCEQVEACNVGIDWSNWNTVPTPGERYELCLLSGCQTGGAAFNAYDGCRWNMCRSDCFANAEDDGYASALLYDTPACMSCVEASCAAQRDACPTATCP